MSGENTLLMVKPDAVAKNAIGDILQRLEVEGFVIRQMRMNHLTREQAEAFYEVHGTIRAEFGTDIQCNAVHASDSNENAAKEIAFYFGD